MWKTNTGERAIYINSRFFGLEPNGLVP